MSNPTWSDIYTADELADALDKHAAIFAKKHGWYEISAEISYAAECIRDFAERCAQGAVKAEKLGRMVEETQRIARASLESLSKLP